jgi:pyruvyltransferase
MKKKVNLIYFKDGKGHGNFGDELSFFITSKLINHDKYELVLNQDSKLTSIDYNIICIGSYIHVAKEDYYIFGSGIRSDPPLEGNTYSYQNLNIKALRGPLSKNFLQKSKINKSIIVPEIYGDPALLLPKFYQPKRIHLLKDKIGLIPHKSNYKHYENKIDQSKFILINPTDPWQNVISSIYSCKCIISSSLHGLICADAYCKPNLWLDEYILTEGDFKFRDYFASQQRPYVKIVSLEDFKELFLYKEGNKINLETLIKVFPFS